MNEPVAAPGGQGRPQVDFYILPDPRGRELLACRLAEKAYGLGHRIYVHTAGEMPAGQFDQMLWTFKQNSFVPHGLCPPPDDGASPVLIGWQPDPPPAHTADDVLINLTLTVPEFFTRFRRVIEVVDQDANALRASRQRFRQYRAQGIEPNTHRL